MSSNATPNTINKNPLAAKTVELSRDIKDKLSRAKTNMLLNEPFFGSLVMQMEFIGATAAITNTMCTDGNNVYINETYLADKTVDHIEFGLTHEIMHIALDHIPRLKDKDRDVWNQATDYVINSELASDPRRKVPQGILRSQKYNHTMSAEDVYDDLMRKKKQQEQDNKGKGDGDNGQQPQQPNAPGHDPGNCGGIMYPQGDANEVEVQFADQKVKVAQALAVAKAQNAGTLPAGLQRLVNAAKPIIDWRPLLRRYMDDMCSQDFTWAKRSRNSLAQDDIYLPGTIANGMDHLVIALDTSGSIDHDLLNAFMAEINTITSELAVKRTTIMYADTMVHRAESFELGDVITANPAGGGGTCFNDTFEVIERDHADASVIIYFTDMETSNFGKDPQKPVIWAAYGDTDRVNMYGQRAGFGDLIHVR